MTGWEAILGASGIHTVDEIRPPIAEVTDAVTSRYELLDRAEDGTIVLGPDTSAEAIMRRRDSRHAERRRLRVQISGGISHGELKRPVRRTMARCSFSPATSAAAAGGQTWRDAWEHATPFMDFGPEVRRVIYTTRSRRSTVSCARRSRPRAASPQRTPPAD